MLIVPDHPSSADLSAAAAALERLAGEHLDAALVELADTRLSAKVMNMVAGQSLSRVAKFLRKLGDDV